MDLVQVDGTVGEVLSVETHDSKTTALILEMAVQEARRFGKASRIT